MGDGAPAAGLRVPSPRHEPDHRRRRRALVRLLGVRPPDVRLLDVRLLGARPLDARPLDVRPLDVRRARDVLAGP
ncbi:hypothetical protein [Actinoallomurus bryophytorum]|uniref:hypothetical protein n=1 Tax=Actinoallomurus bryophytorum TaxID=1490222 RepID=UPI00114EC676|nr:hypothetical protein [Actinoallomurus bryophytorum]